MAILTKDKLLDFLTEEAQGHGKRALESIRRNAGMNRLSPKDFAKLDKNPLLVKKLAGVILIDFINFIRIFSLETATSVITKGELLDFLTEEAQTYHKKPLSSIKTNRHRSSLSSANLKKLSKTPKLTNKLIEAVLVDFINFIGVGQGINFGLKTENLEP